MKKTLFAIALTLLGAFAYAQTQPVVAVAPFDVISGVSEVDAAMISDVFFVRLGNTKKVELVNRTIVQRVIKEHNFQMEDWSNKEKTAALGEALNANWLVQGDIRKMGSGILVIVQFYNINTFKFEGGTDLRLANADEAYDKMNPLVDNLIQTISMAKQTYKIGDRGPGGGFVFFAENGVYMECSMDIGSYTWGQAVTAVKNYKGGGFNDWRLPSTGELELMYKNLKQKGLGGFGNTRYWSSRSHSAVTAYFFSFSTGFVDLDANNKTTIYSVRAVRSF